MANHLLRGEKAVETLQPTALVNEALINLCAGAEVQARDQRHYVNIAAQQLPRNCWPLMTPCQH